MSFSEKKKKDLKCKECETIVFNVGDDAVSVICTECTANYVRGYKIDKEYEDRPYGDCKQS